MFVANEILAANEVDGVKRGDESIKKYEKLSKTRKLSKSQKSAKLGKELSKNWNLPNLNTKKNGPSFLTPNTKTAFNHLRLAFTKAPIHQYFDLECYIWIETNASSYAINGMLS